MKEFAERRSRGRQRQWVEAPICVTVYPGTRKVLTAHGIGGCEGLLNYLAPRM